MTASQSGVFSLQQFGDLGAPLVGGRLYTYTFGTTTHKTAYTDKAGTIAHTYTSDGAGGQYIALNARGELPAPLYLTSGSYDIALKRADGSTVWTRRADPSEDASIDAGQVGFTTTPATAYPLGSIGRWLVDLALSTGSELIGWVQSGAGAVKRFVQDKLRDTVSVKDFGAVGDNSTDDTAAFNAALANLLARGGGTLYIPDGVYKITSRLVYAPSGQQHLTIRGTGRYQVTLNFRGATALGIYFNSTSTTDNQLPVFEVRDIGLVTTRQDAGTALHFNFASSNNLDGSVRVQDVLIAQNVDQTSDSGSGYGYWSHGVKTFNARNGQIRNLHAYGELNVSPNSSHGVHLDGESTAFVITDSLLLEWTTGIEAAGTSEGLYVSQTDVVYCRYGIRHTSLTGAQPQLTVSSCSVNTSNVGVWLLNSQCSVISDTLFFASAVLDTGTWPEYTGVLIDGNLSRYNKVANCTFTKENERTGDTCTGIDFNEGGWGTAVGNHFFGFSANLYTFGIQARSSVSRIACDHTNMFENVSSPFSWAAGSQAVMGEITVSGRGTYATGATIQIGHNFSSAPVIQVVHEGTNTVVNVLPSNITSSSFVVNHNNGSAAAIGWTATGKSYV